MFALSPQKISKAVCAKPFPIYALLPRNPSEVLAMGKCRAPGHDCNWQNYLLEDFWLSVLISVDDQKNSLILQIFSELHLSARGPGSTGHTKTSTVFSEMELSDDSI